MSWNKLVCNKKDLHLLGTLSGGQSFRWTFNKESEEWIGVFSKTVWKLRQKDDLLQYIVVGSLLNKAKSKKNKSESPENKDQISSLVEKLCTHYGEEICQHDGVTYYAFPEVEKLSQSKVESELRNLGFGYRAKFIQKSASQIVEWGGCDWFKSLQDMKYKDARVELMKLHGIGPKVADCICLMSLKHLESLPVDTHVYQIAAQNYLPHLRGKKNVTEKMYAEIGDHFRTLY
ncbi:putative N-glycosylase/DNA lyase, partial [Operophtera brumata]